MTQQTLEILQNARARLARGWCTRYLALDSAGRMVPSWKPSARSWCALGAVEAELGKGWGWSADVPALNALQAAVPAHFQGEGYCGGYSRIAAFNNATDQATVLALFDRAISQVRGALQRPTSELVAELMEKVTARAQQEAVTDVELVLD